MELDRAVAALMKLGWSEYESRTYAALIREGMATASHIAKSSEIPSNKIYQILEKLSSTGYVNRIQGKGSVALFVAKPPSQVLGMVMKEFEERIKDAEHALNELNERLDRPDFPVAYTILGRREMHSQIKEMLEACTDEFLLLIDTLSDLNFNRLAKLLIELYQQGVKVKVLTSIRGINDPYEIEAFQRISPIEVRVSEAQLSNVIVLKDRREVLIASYSVVDTKSEIKDFVGMYSTDEQFAGMMANTFITQWETATPTLRN